MAPDEQLEFRKVAREVEALTRAVVGTDHEDFRDGLLYRFRRVEEEVRIVTEKQKEIKATLKGIVVGLIVAAFVFGWLTFKDIIGLVK
jgi:hypothetical protein